VSLLVIVNKRRIWKPSRMWVDKLVHNVSYAPEATRETPVETHDCSEGWRHSRLLKKEVVRIRCSVSDSACNPDHLSSVACLFSSDEHANDHH
jgi:hypothetical protein